MPDPHDPNFWRGEARGLADEFRELVMRVIIRGATSAVNMLPNELKVFMNWDIFNQSAIDYLHMYLGDPGAVLTPGTKIFEWATSITETTRRAIIQDIDNWIRSGDPLYKLKDAMRRNPAYAGHRAEQIAITEVTRTYADGNLMAWNASGVVTGKVWRTANDERVCPICGPLHDTLVEIDQEWQFTEEMIAANPALAKAIKSAGQNAFMAPPAHVNCRCGLVPAILEDLTDEEIAAKRFGEGGPQAGQVPTSENKIGQYLERPKTGKYAQRYDKAISSIERVHDVTGMQTTQIKTKRLSGGTMGEYRFKGEGGVISIDPDKGDEFTLIHEIGHSIDHQSIMFPGRFDSEMGSIQLNEWQNAVRNSDAYNTLAEMRANPSAHSVPVTLPGNIHTYAAPSERQLSYLLDDRELFARSYAQYIAEKTGDDLLLSQLSELRADRLYGASQWATEDFAPISQALDNMFGRLGWIP